MDFHVSFGWLWISWLYTVLPGVLSTVCSDAAKNKNINSVLRMCESGNAVASKVVVDTHDSARYGVGSCRCDIAFIANGIAQLTYDRVGWLHPGVANCGSEMTLYIGGTSILFLCTLYKSSQLAVAHNRLSYLTWKSKRQNSRSEYCMLFELTPDAAKLNITCIATTRSMTTQAPSTEPTTFTTTTSAKPTSSTTITSSSPESTTTQPITTTTTSQETSTRPSEATTSQSLHTISTGVDINITTVIVTSTTMSGPTDKQTITTGGLKDSNNGQEKDLLMTVIVPAAGAGGGLILIITVVALIVMCRRKENPKQKNYNEDEDGGMHANVLYISADEVEDIKPKIAETNHDFATDTQDKNDALQNKECKNEIVIPEQPQGAVYAVVNKQKTAGNAENKNLRVSSNNEEGLNYTEVELDGDTDRPPSIPPPLISVKDNEDNRVTYSEVRTESE